MACGKHSHFAVEKGQKIECLPIKIRNKEERYMLVVFALGCILINLYKFLYQMKAEIIYFVFRGYNNNGFLSLKSL